MNKICKKIREEFWPIVVPIIFFGAIGYITGNNFLTELRTSPKIINTIFIFTIIISSIVYFFIIWQNNNPNKKIEDQRFFIAFKCLIFIGKIYFSAIISNILIDLILNQPESKEPEIKYLLWIGYILLLLILFPLYSHQIGVKATLVRFLLVILYMCILYEPLIEGLSSKEGQIILLLLAIPIFIYIKIHKPK